MESFDTLVLPGGGIKGFYLLGAIQALIDSNIIHDIKTYIGTSIGAIIGYLLAIGYTPIEIVVYLSSNRSLEKLHGLNIVSLANGNGVLAFTAINEILEKMTIDKIGIFLTLGKLKEKFGKTLVCTTYNMTTCTVEYLDPENHPDLPCLTALRMSANIPLIFDRFKYMDNFYIDGGIADNFPISKASEIGKKVLGIYLSISESSLRDDPDDGVVAYFLRLLQIQIVHSSKMSIKMIDENCKVCKIDTGELRNIIQFDIKSKIKLEMFSSGYSQAKKHFEICN